MLLEKSNLKIKLSAEKSTFSANGWHDRLLMMMTFARGLRVVQRPSLTRVSFGTAEQRQIDKSGAIDHPHQGVTIKFYGN